MRPSRWSRGRWIGLGLSWLVSAPAAADPLTDQEVEPVYASAQVLRQRGPSLGGYGQRQLLELAFPGLHEAGTQVLAVEPLIARVQALRGPFVFLGPQGAYPGTEAVALLVVHESRSGDHIDWNPELLVFGMSQGRPRLLARGELGEHAHDFDKATDAGSGYKLEGLRLHPKADGLAITSLRTETGPQQNNAVGELSVYFVSEAGELVEVLQRSVLDQTVEQSADGSQGEATRARLTIDRGRQVGGLYQINVETHRAETEQGLLRREETEYEYLCWQAGAYDECAPPAPAGKAKPTGARGPR